MDEVIIPFGKKQVIDGRLRIFINGYWVKAYDVPADTLHAKKRLIEALTRRLFNHTEHGINIPGRRLDESRRAYDSEGDPQRKRVKGAMLAGCLFNRATDIFTKLVELEELGVKIRPDNALMRECGEHLREALTLGKMVLHQSGEEGLDELWGEPFKAFAYGLEEFYSSRYIKVAQSMRAIDEIRDVMIATFAPVPDFAGVEPLLRDLAATARSKVETLQTDPEIFDIWPSFVVAAERLAAFQPARTVQDSITCDRPGADASERLRSQGLQLLRFGKDLIYYVTRARVPMPKSAREFAEKCEQFRRLYTQEGARSVA
jgi:hypothetical protein